MANVGAGSIGWVKEALHEVEKYRRGEGYEKGFLGTPLACCSPVSPFAPHARPPRSRFSLCCVQPSPLGP